MLAQKENRKPCMNDYDFDEWLFRILCIEFSNLPALTSSQSVFPFSMDQEPSESKLQCYILIITLFSIV